MNPWISEIARWFRRRAEDVAVVLLGVMFVSFIFQIIFRYIFNWPTNWSFELSILTWLWVVLWGAAFVVAEKDEIRFDVIYGLLSPRVRAIFTVMTGVALVVIYGMSLPAVTDYVMFMRVERTPSLGLRFDWVFSVYVIFAVAVIIRYIWLTWWALRGKSPETLISSNEIDINKSGSSL